MVTILKRPLLCSHRPPTRGAVWLLLLASAFIWAGCSGGSSTEESAGTDQAQDAPANNAEQANEQQATADASNEAPEPEPPGEAPFDTTFLDAETELFLFTRVGDILDSSLVQMLTGGNLGPLNALEQQLGVAPQDIDTVTVGVSQLAQRVEQSAAVAAPLMASALMGPQGMPGLGRPQRGGFDTEDYDDAGMDDDALMDDDDFEDSPDGMDGGDDGGGQENAPQASGKGVVAVVRTKTPIDVERFAGLPGIERVKQGKSAFYRLASNSSPDMPCLYLYDETTLVASDEVTIKDIIKQGIQRARPTADLGFVESAPHLLLAIAPKDKAALNKAGSMFSLPGGAMMGATAIPSAPRAVTARSTTRRPREDEGYDDETEDDGTLEEDEGDERGGRGAGSGSTGEAFFDEHTDAFALLIDLSAGIGLNVVLKCDQDDAAQQMLREIDDGMDAGKSQFEAMKGTLPGVIRMVAQPLVDSLAASAADGVVRIALALPEEQQAMLPMVPPAMMGMMMRGMGPAGGGAVAMVPSLGEFALEILFDGQPAANPEELPQGLELKARTRWGQSVYGDQAPPPLEIGIVAHGGPAANAVAFGQLNLAEARVDDATVLKWTGTLNDPTDENPMSDLVPIKREGILADHPRDAVATGFVVAPPANPATSLAVVSGELTLQIAEGEHAILFPDVKDLRDQRPIGTNLRKLDDLQTRFSTYDRGTYEELNFGYLDSPQVGQVELIGVNGTTLLTSPPTTSIDADGRTTLTYMFPGGIPPATGLRIKLYSDVQTVVVPFRFENLPVPDSPQLTEQQQALLVWTAAEPPPGIEDLTIEAQGRWKTLERVAPVAQGFNPAFGNQQRRFGSDDLTDEGLDMELGDDTEMEIDDFDDAGDDADEGSFGGRRPQRLRPGGRNPGGPQAVPQSENPLRIVVDLVGPLTQIAEGIGFVDVASATTNIDTTLTYEGAEFGSASENPTYEFVQIGRQQKAAEEHPPGGLRVVLKLTPPNQPIQGLSRLNGSLKFKTVREKAEAIVTNIESRTKARISHPDLTKLGIKFYAQIEGSRMMMRLAEGKDDRIAEVIPVDLNGSRISNVNASKQPGGAKAEGRMIYQFDFPGGIPEKVGLKFIVNMGIEEVTVPIHIENLPLPPMPIAAS